MIIGYIVCLLCGVLVYFITTRLTLTTRIVLGILVAAFLVLAFTGLVNRIGDKPVGNSHTISKEEWNKFLESKGREGSPIKRPSVNEKVSPFTKK